MFGVIFGSFWVVPGCSGLFQPGCSGLFQPVLACCGMFRDIIFLEASTLQNVLIFVKKELYLRFYHKVLQALLESGADLIYYKLGQVLLQICSNFLLQREASSITK